MPVQGVLARQQTRWSCVAAARPRTARPPWRLRCWRNLSASSGRLGVVQGVQCALEKISLKIRFLGQTTLQRHLPKSSVSMSCPTLRCSTKNLADHCAESRLRLRRATASSSPGSAAKHVTHVVCVCPDPITKNTLLEPSPTTAHQENGCVHKPQAGRTVL